MCSTRYRRVSAARCREHSNLPLTKSCLHYATATAFPQLLRHLTPAVVSAAPNGCLIVIWLLSPTGMPPCRVVLLWLGVCIFALLSTTLSAQSDEDFVAASDTGCTVHAQYMLSQLEGTPTTDRFHEVTDELVDCAFLDDASGGLPVYQNDQLMLLDDAQADVLMALSHALSWDDDACPAALRRFCGKGRGRCGAASLVHS